MGNEQLEPLPKWVREANDRFCLCRAYPNTVLDEDEQSDFNLWAQTQVSEIHRRVDRALLVKSIAGIFGGGDG